MDEIKNIVEKALVAQGVKIVPFSVDIQTHTEGRYEDAVQVTDGLSFELAEPKPAVVTDTVYPGHSSVLG